MRMKIVKLVNMHFSVGTILKRVPYLLFFIGLSEQKNTKKCAVNFFSVLIEVECAVTRMFLHN